MNHLRTSVIEMNQPQTSLIDVEPTRDDPYCCQSNPKRHLFGDKHLMNHMHVRSTPSDLR